MILFIIRGAFLVLVAAVITFFVREEFQEQAGVGFSTIVAIIGVTIAVAAIVIALDVSTKNKRLSSISGIFLGLIAGLTVAYALSFVVDLIGAYITPELSADGENAGRIGALENLLRGIKVIIGLVTCYLGISLVIQTKDDFRFVLPYVEFAKEVRGNRPTLLDTSVIIDGRILDIITTHILQSQLIVPQFVLDELQTLADSGDRIKRMRGRRGLEMLQKLQALHEVEVTIMDQDAEGQGVDQKLIDLAGHLKARIMTNDFNLNKVATLRDIDVINLNDLAKALRPVVLPGESMQVKLVKPGESDAQGVGYLDDGTMVVVEGGRPHLESQTLVTVTSTLQTSAGRMIFARFDQVIEAEESERQADAPVEHAAANDEPPQRGKAGSRRNPRRR
jgi:uncharacterized protein YacL